jgi:mono/diheme cytochrome c family protein
MRYFYLIFVFSIVTVLSITGFRGSKSKLPPWEIFPDMDRQDRYRAQGESPFFADGRGDRPSVPGAVAFQSFVEDVYFSTGKVEGGFGAGFPIPVNHELMALGQEKFNIFCSVCHGESGDGQGATKAQSLSMPMIATPSYHDDRLRDMPEGELFNTITYGKNTMGAYGTKLRPRERWAVVAYLRALQRAQNSALADVPAANREKLEL